MKTIIAKTHVIKHRVCSVTPLDYTLEIEQLIYTNIIPELKTHTPCLIQGKTKDEELVIELQEKKGSRNFSFAIPYYIINQPIKL